MKVGGSMESFLTLLLYLAPALFGGYVAYMKPQAILSWVDRLDHWVSRRYDATTHASGWFVRWCMRPWLWTMQTVSRWTQAVQDQGQRAGIKVAAYLYVTWIIGSIAVVATMVVAVVVAIGVVLPIWDAISGRRELRPATPRAVAPRWGPSEGREVLSRLFGVEIDRVDDDGVIYQAGVLPLRIGRIDSTGEIHDTRPIVRELIGRIEISGDIIAVRNRERVGRVDSSGQIRKMLF